MITEKKFYTIRGKIISCTQTIEEALDFIEIINEVFNMIEEASIKDFYGTEGYKHILGWD